MLARLSRGFNMRCMTWEFWFVLGIFSANERMMRYSIGRVVSPQSRGVQQEKKGVRFL